jgi:hypothetical protein
VYVSTRKKGWGWFVLFEVCDKLLGAVAHIEKISVLTNTYRLGRQQARWQVQYASCRPFCKVEARVNRLFGCFFYWRRFQMRSIIRFLFRYQRDCIELDGSMVRGIEVEL